MTWGYEKETFRGFWKETFPGVDSKWYTDEDNYVTMNRRREERIMTIAEVSRKYDISPDTLRYYERVGLIPRVERTSGGIRNYNEESCRWIELVKCMRGAGVHIESLVEYCTLMQQGNSTITARKELLAEEREKLLTKQKEIQETLERLNYKIQVYEEAEKTGILNWDNKKEENKD